MIWTIFFWFIWTIFLCLFELLDATLFFDAHANLKIIKMLLTTNGSNDHSLNDQNFKRPIFQKALVQTNIQGFQALKVTPQILSIFIDSNILKQYSVKLMPNFKREKIQGKKTKITIVLGFSFCMKNWLYKES